MPLDFTRVADTYAAQYGIPPGLFRRLISKESNWNPRAGSPAGAQGLTQLMPGTARGLGVTNPWDPVQNIRGGAQYLAQQKKRFGRWDLALSAYNSGPGGSESSGRVEAFPETQKYVRSILGSIGPSSSAPVSAGATMLASPGLVFSRENAVNQARRTFATGLISSFSKKGKARTDEMINQALTMRHSLRQINELALKMGQTTSVPTAMNLRRGPGEIGSLDQLLGSTGQTVTSGFRPGARTKRGTASLHSVNRARDIDHRDPDFGKLVNLVRSNPRRFKEFFYDPLGWYVKNGSVIKGSIGGHSDHAHVAM